MRTPIALIGCLAMLVACGGADRGSSSSTGCQQGLLIDSEAGPICVFRRDQPLVIEGGFVCPADFAYRIDMASSIACSSRAVASVPHEVCAEIPEDCSDAGASVPQAGAGAGPDVGSGCGRPSGSFDAAYDLRSGNCGAVSSTSPIPIDGGVTIEKFADRDIETDTVIQGCQLSLVQTVRGTDGQPQQQVQGSALEIESPTQISGPVTVTRFDANGQPECSGEYDLVLTQNATVIGGASQ